MSEILQAIVKKLEKSYDGSLFIKYYHFSGDGNISNILQMDIEWG